MAVFYFQRHSKVLLKLFQKLVGQGQRPCRSPQRAKYFMPHKAQEGRKTFQWNVFRREPSQGVPCKTNIANNRKKAVDKVHRSGAKNVKGFALKTHEGLRPSTLRAFSKARAKLLVVLGKIG